MTGTELRAWREKQGWTQVRAAAELQVYPGLVSEWERGARGRRIPPYITRMVELIAQVDALRAQLAEARGIPESELEAPASVVDRRYRRSHRSQKRLIPVSD